MDVRSGLSWLDWEHSISWHWIVNIFSLGDVAHSLKMYERFGFVHEFFLIFPLRVKVLPSPFLSYSGTLEWNLIQWCNTKYVIASTIEIPMESTGMQSYHEWNLKNTIPNCMKGGKTYYSGHCHVRQMDCCSFSLILSIC
jgi:hypothetical protein